MYFCVLLNASLHSIRSSKWSNDSHLRYWWTRNLWHQTSSPPTDNKLTSGQRTIRDFSRELTKLQNSYDSAIGHRDDAKKELALERNSQQMQRWEIEHLVKREKDYTERLDKVHLEIVGLKSKLPMLGGNFIFLDSCHWVTTSKQLTLVFLFFWTEEGCQRCLPGWIFLNPTCYYLPWLDTAMRRTWWDARKFCQRYKGDLAMIDSTDKHVRRN